MDVDWCLSCERRIDAAAAGPYCSVECLSCAHPASSSRIAHPGIAHSDAHRIACWARAIPPHVPAGAPTLPFADTHPSSLPLPPPRPSPRLDTHQPISPTPKLIARNSVPTPHPTHCLSSPAHARGSCTSAITPVLAVQSPLTPCTASDASTSLTSLLSEPMVVTPDEDCSFGAGFTALVRSFVHRSRSRSSLSPRGHKEDSSALGKTRDHPPLPSPLPFSSRRMKKMACPPAPRLLPAPSSASAVRRAPAMRARLFAPKPVSTYGRGMSPSETHTPTPVVFPSCRAVDLDWDEGDDDDDECEKEGSVVRARTRTPSSATSVSSTGSVLLIAPKRWGALRGRGAAITPGAL